MGIENNFHIAVHSWEYIFEGCGNLIHETRDCLPADFVPRDDETKLVFVKSIILLTLLGRNTRSKEQHILFLHYHPSS